MQSEMISCKQCGKCCEQGGPALHTQDIDLLVKKEIPVSSLITLRKGELAHNPKTNQIQGLGVELVKLIGSGRTWNCVYYDGEHGCTIYDRRPHACKALKCWDTEEILALVETDTLDRIMILGQNHSMIPIIAEHERICPCDDLEYLRKNYRKLSDAEKKDVERRVRHDLRFRSRIINDFDLKLNEELFYFGRPLFQLLQPLGVKVSEIQNEIRLQW